MDSHSHVFLGEGHEHAEMRTWWVIGLCGAMMVLEIAGGMLFGSIALVADGLHMTTHAGALLLAALAYRYARRHATDARFTFGTGKLGDLAGFTSAIVLAMIGLLIGWEAVSRLLAPVPIAFGEAIPIACLGLAVNVASAWLLGGGHHGHDHAAFGHMPRGDRAHGHGAHGHGEHGRGAHGRGEHGRGAHGRGGHDDFQPGSQPGHAHGEKPHEERAHAAHLHGHDLVSGHAQVGHGQAGHGHDHGHDHGHGPSSGDGQGSGHGSAHRDNNMRAAVVHVMADAAVSVLVIVGLLLAQAFGWMWMDPLAGIVGACVIASWAYGLVRDTGRILMDMNPDQDLTERLRREIETDGDRLTDLHVWRVGPGHLAAVLSVATGRGRRAEDYHQRLRHFPTLSHVTVEVDSR